MGKPTANPLLFTMKVKEHVHLSSDCLGNMFCFLVNSLPSSVSYVNLSPYIIIIHSGLCVYHSSQIYSVHNAFVVIQLSRKIHTQSGAYLSIQFLMWPFPAEIEQFEQESK